MALIFRWCMQESTYFLLGISVLFHLQVCTPALNILTDMGVLKELENNNEAHFADSGGFVSPSGLAYIGTAFSKATADSLQSFHPDHQPIGVVPCKCQDLLAP